MRGCFGGFGCRKPSANNKKKNNNKPTLANVAGPLAAYLGNRNLRSVALTSRTLRNATKENLAKRKQNKKNNLKRFYLSGNRFTSNLNPNNTQNVKLRKVLNMYFGRGYNIRYTENLNRAVDYLLTLNKQNINHLLQLYSPPERRHVFNNNRYTLAKKMGLYNKNKFKPYNDPFWRRWHEREQENRRLYTGTRLR